MAGKSFQRVGAWLAAGALLILAGVACSSSALGPAQSPAPSALPATQPSSSQPVATPTPPTYTAINDVFKELSPTGDREFDELYFDQLLEPGDIEAIYHEYIRLAAADEVDLQPEELVIGVSIADESRAYPIRTLRFREMVNDVLGGVPILVSW